MQDFIFNHLSAGKKSKIFLFTSLLFLILTNCQKEEAATRDYPRFVTQAVTEISSSGAKFTAEILSGDLSEVTEYGFCWNKYVEPKLDGGENLVYKGTLAAKQFSGNVQSLQNNQIYYLRSYIKTSNRVIYGTVVTFKTLN